MPPVVDVKKLLNLETLRRKINWPNITENVGDHGAGIDLAITIHPDNPHWPPIILICNQDRSYLDQLRFDATHAHSEGPDDWRADWRLIRMARDLVSGRKCLLEMIRDGQPRGWYILGTNKWPDDIYPNDCLPATEDDSGVLALNGQRWLPPTFRRILFNREPFDDQPDWNDYLPVKYGWMTRAMYVRIKAVEDSVGTPPERRLT